MSIEIDQTKAKKAFSALFKHETNTNPDSEEAIWLMVSTFNKINAVNQRPTRIVLKHGCQLPGVYRCLFTKKNQQQHKDTIREKKIKGVHKVIDLKHLKKQHSSIEAKRKLMEDFDMFMAEKTILDDLHKILGKEVYKKRREPIPIDLHKPDLQKEILRTAKSTYMNFHFGSCYAVKIATTAQNATVAFENFMSAYKKVVAATPGGVENIRSFQIKTSNSVSLPIYDATQEGPVNQEEDPQDDDAI